MKLSLISWNVTEDVYRKDSALSYSTLAKYEREGFNGLYTLFDKVESPSLTFGSAVDSIITGGMEEFNNNFYIQDYEATDSIIKVVKSLYYKYKDTYKSLHLIPIPTIIEETQLLSYQLNWKPETRAKVIIEKGSVYYNLLFIAKNKTIIDTETYKSVNNAVESLYNSKATSFYFAPNNPFDSIERFYQLKFKAKLNGVYYRCMADLILVDNNKKEIHLIDLKTSSHKEYDFYKSFVDWSYHIQARLYYRIIKHTIRQYKEFDDYTILPYKFIVVNRWNLTPLVWEFEDTFEEGTLQYNNVSFRDPYVIGKELYDYLQNKPNVPKGINIDSTNSLKEWLNRL